MKPSILLMGSKPGSVAALGVLVARGWDVCGVVTSSEFNHGDVLRERADEHGIPVYSEQADRPDGLAVDFVVSYMYRKRVTADTLSLARRGALNFHAGPLPEFGGFAFYNVAILEGVGEYGCTCHYMDESFDTGPILEVRRFRIDVEVETAVSLERRTQQEMLRLFVDFCRLAESGRPLPRREQDPGRMRYLTREEFQALKEIPDGADEATVQRYARAFWYPPYQGAYIRRGAVIIEVVPEIVKGELSTLLHEDDLAHLEAVVAKEQLPASERH